VDKDPIEIRKEAGHRILSHDYTQGPLLLIAGPGTGKTYSILETIKFQLKKGYVHSDFFEATLTNAAAKDFNEEAKKAITLKFESSSTLHYRAKGILHKHAQLLKLNSGFTVINDEYRELILRDISYILHGSHKEFKKELGSYHKASAQLITKDDEFSQIYMNFQFYYAAIDWFDVVKLACQLLNDHQSVRDAECYKFKFVLIDEYQDLNQADQRFVKLLLNGRTNLLAVGDNDQSIYSWRYAEPEGITNFNDHYPTAKQEPLLVTSRLPSKVIDASYSLISKNKTHDPTIKKLIPLKENDQRTNGGFVISVNLKSDKAEFEFIHKALTELINNKIKPDQILVLCNSKALGIELIEKLKKADNKLPIQNGLEEEQQIDDKVFLLKHIRNFIANKEDNLSLRVIMEKLLEPQANDSSFLASRSFQRRISLWDTITDQSLSNQLDNSRVKIDGFVGVIIKAEQLQSPNEKICYILNAIPSFESLLDIIREEEKPDDSATQDEISEKEAKIRFLTPQSSKGLDADIVFIPFMEESIGLTAADIEEKRRLLYVALTRAKVGVILSWAWSRTSYKKYKSVGGGGQPTGRKPSTFINECGINPSLCFSKTTPSSSEVALKILAEHATRMKLFDNKLK
jgi:DNA helicase-2/ATP-dependent DNA helicase PcrA